MKRDVYFYSKLLSEGMELHYKGTGPLDPGAFGKIVRIGMSPSILNIEVRLNDGRLFFLPPHAFVPSPGNLFLLISDYAAAEAVQGEADCKPKEA
ncbi:MAG: hypothetical protein IMZ57_11015 [Acidobacteria bacterium]|nr:hypothetical protein [Acidobacteriota bacterium]